MACGGEDSKHTPLSQQSTEQEILNQASLNQKPKITLIGESTIELNLGETYNELGASGSDNEDGELSDQIIIDNSQVNTKMAGDYLVTYRLFDSARNEADEVLRQVKVSQLIPSSKADAARFLYRSTFGPTPDDMQDLLNQGYDSWLKTQFELPPSYQSNRVEQLMGQYGYSDIFSGPESRYSRMLRSDVWWDTVVNGNDQLRQRVAFALSQIFVVSEKDSNLKSRVRGLASYTDVLIRHAFGNFRDLLKEVTLHPMMGDYLSMSCNQRVNRSGTIQPDENYAREIMQLFTIGLKKLNLDGTEVLDNKNQPIETYNQYNILSFARVFTGWSYGDSSYFCEKKSGSDRNVLPMKAFDDFHDKSRKLLLNNQILPANQSAEQDLQMALDNLFNHSNVAPFISKQLIQSLVTSNPTPGYVERVARVFNDNGDGVRGDLKAVVKAILLDASALLGHQENPYYFGKLKEPIIKLINLWRAFEAEGVAGRLRYYHSSYETSQQHLASTSVFNFFLPSYSNPGEIRDKGLLSPEFQIVNETTTISTQNQLIRYINGADYGADLTSRLNQINLNLEPLNPLAKEPGKLVEKLNELLFAGSMTSSMQEILIDFVKQIPLEDDGIQRVKECLYLVVLSPEFAYQR